MEFRDDINALRAIAVLGVVLFHFDITGLPGGFTGVDVFFVISGYLMTRIITEGLHKGTFQLSAFYVARAKRISPALLALLLSLISAGFFFLTASDYEKLADHAAYAAIFYSNVKFWRESGYFDSDAVDKWLLHTWSLSVEWQFYIALPIFFLLIHRFARHSLSLHAALLGSLFVSLGYSIWLTGNDATAAFYGLPARAWQMLAGGAIYLAGERWSPDKPLRKLMAMIGLAGIFLSFIAIDESDAWPGLYALLPTACTALVIQARHSFRYPGDSILQWIGSRSYSIYLWHWPIVAAIHHAALQDHWQATAIGLAASLALGHISFVLIEQPSKTALSAMPKARASMILVACTLLVFLAATAIKEKNGLPARLPEHVTALERESENTNPRRSECHGGSKNTTPECIYGGNNIKAVILGDSHASATVTALAAALDSPTEGVLSFTHTGCPTILGAKRIEAGHGCHDFNQEASDRIQSLAGDIPVVIINRMSEHVFGSATTPHEQPVIMFDKRAKSVTDDFLAEVERRTIETYCTLARSREVYVMRPFPEMPSHIPQAMSRNALLGVHTRTSIGLDEYHQRHGFVWRVQDTAAQKCGIHILDPLPYLCKNGICRGDKDGMPLYSDDNHLSERGNRLLIPLFKTVLTHAQASK